MPVNARLCNACEVPLRDGESWLCGPCAEDYDAEVEERIAEEEARPVCSCAYCFCLNKTEDGGVCDDCRVHAHQG